MAAVEGCNGCAETHPFCFAQCRQTHLSKPPRSSAPFDATFSIHPLFSLTVRRLSLCPETLSPSHTRECRTPAQTDTGVRDTAAALEITPSVSSDSHTCGCIYILRFVSKCMLWLEHVKFVSNMNAMRYHFAFPCDRYLTIVRDYLHVYAMAIVLFDRRKLCFHQRNF